jgi:hypothetical protein
VRKLIAAVEGAMSDSGEAKPWPATMRRSKDFRIVHEGRQYGGWFEVEGGDVLVASAYGSKRGPKGRRDALKVAEALLLEMVKARP